MPKHQKPRTVGRLGSYTLVELMLALTITAIIMTALASLSYAVGVQWHAGDSGQSVELMARRAGMQVRRFLEQSPHVGASSPGQSFPWQQGAWVVFWMSDTNGDGAMQMSEIGLVQYDPPSGQLQLLTVPRSSCYDPVWDTSVIDAVSAQSLFQVVNSGKVAVRPLAGSVTSASFYAYDSANGTRCPSIEYVFKLSRDGKTASEYGTAAARNSLNGTTAWPH